MFNKQIKFPSYIQHDRMDCGPSCLKIIAKYYGKTLSMKYLRELCHITREGVSMFDIARAAESIGMTTLAIKADFNDLRDKLPLPLIVHWEQRHFIVVYKIDRHKVYVSDPSYGLRIYTHREFEEGWELTDRRGSVMMLEPTNDFYDLENNETSSSLRHFMKYLKPYQRYLIQVIVGMILGILISLVSPFISQSIVDFGIGSGNMKFINTMLVAGVVLSVSSMLSGFIQSRIMLYVSGRVNMRMVSDFLRKILALPVTFFERKMVSDIMTRIGDLSRIQSFIMNTFLGIIVNTLLFVVYSAMMLYYQQNMFIIFITGNLIYLGWIMLFLKERKRLDNLAFEAHTSNQHDLLELLNNVDEIKTNNIANRRRWKWEFSRYNIYGLNVKELNLGQIQSTGAAFIAQIQNVILTYVAAKNVVDGNMTLGMMMAVQNILGQLSGPISRVC